jgi:MoaA/NifB/PqqE/SkfB family radical SAM enzyme
MQNGFGKVVLMRGWDFKKSDYEKAIKNKKLLTASIENTNYCNLDCKYCFRGGMLPGAERKSGEIARNELFFAIDELSLAGVKAIYIVGAGEPLMDENISGLLEYIHGKGIIPVVATNGSLITPELVKIFNKTNTSVCLKLNTFNSELQDNLVQRKGYSKKRDNALKLLMSAGFNKPGKNYQTRLAINSIVFKDNKEEIPKILKFCRENNIQPVMSTFMPVGRTKIKTEQEVSLKDFIALSKKLKNVDSEKYGLNYEGVLPYLGGVPCSQCGRASLFISITGDIFDCPGQLNKYGNIRETSIMETLEKINASVGNPDFGCTVREEYWKKTNTLNELISLC